MMRIDMAARGAPCTPASRVPAHTSSGGNTLIGSGAVHSAINTPGCATK